jgi:hypothetical protein
MLQKKNKNMGQEKLYFRSIDDTTCYSLETHFEDARDEELTKIKLVEAIPDDGTNDVVWCTHYVECVDKDQCKKTFCEHYSSKSGRGVCEHRGNLYLHGEEVTFDVPQL